MAPRRMETKPLILCVKILLLFYSFIFWVTGVVLLAVGLWWRFMLSPYTLLISSAPSNAPFVLTGTGVAIVLFGLFGCFATCRGHPWMLKLRIRLMLAMLIVMTRRRQLNYFKDRDTAMEPFLRDYERRYGIFLALVFLIELIAGISGFIFRHEIKGTFLTTYSEALLRYDGRSDRSVAVDDVQRKLQCCGVHNYTTWFASDYFPTGGIPVSCCVTFSDCKETDLKNATLAARKVHKQGCYQLVTSFIESNMGIIAGVTFGIAFSQLIGMSLACCLSHFINTNQYEMV